MSYLRFIWFVVERDGVLEAIRWAENASPSAGRQTLPEYCAEHGYLIVSGPYKTRKKALENLLK
jgi:hypothetical protein